MNNLIVISNKADRAKPKNPNAPVDPIKEYRGAPMQSRQGRETQAAFTCYFRGANGETGGKTHSENVDSYVRKLKQRIEKNTSDKCNDLIETNDVKEYITVEGFKREAELKKQQADLAKQNLLKDSQPEPQKLTSLTSSNAGGAANKDGVTINSQGEEKVTDNIFTQNPPHQVNLYERIASEMRSKAVREEIKMQLKQTKMQRNIQNQTAQAQESMSRRGKAHSTDDQTTRKKVKSFRDFNCRKNQPGGHQVWAKQGEGPKVTNQWESAISREAAQYYQVEKHARDCDLEHDVQFKGVDAKEQAVHMDDQVLTEVRKKKYRVPTCLQAMPMCSFKNRQYVKQQKSKNLSETLAAAIFLTGQGAGVSLMGKRETEAQGQIQTTIASDFETQTVQTQRGRSQVKHAQTQELATITESTVRGSKAKSKNGSPVRQGTRRTLRDIKSQVLKSQYSQDMSQAGGSTRSEMNVSSPQQQKHVTEGLGQIQEIQESANTNFFDMPYIETPKKHRKDPIKENIRQQLAYEMHSKKIQSMNMGQIQKALKLGSFLGEMFNAQDIEAASYSPEKSNYAKSVLNGKRGIASGTRTHQTRTSFHSPEKLLRTGVPQQVELIDRPDLEPEDPKIKYTRFMDKIPAPIDFDKQRSKQAALNDSIQILDDKRFEIIHDLSEWNSKFGSRIGHPFQRSYRNTDIPGTVKNSNIQKNGPDNDVFIDCNADVGKRSLTLGMVDLSRQFNHRDTLTKTNQMTGRGNWKGIGTQSDPWDYDPESVWKGQQKLSTFKNNQSLVRPFAKQIPRTKFGSIYGKAEDEAFTDPLVPTEEEQETIRHRMCASEVGMRTNPNSRRGNRGRNDSHTVKSLSSFRKNERANKNMMSQQSDKSSISMVSYADFLPNSIAKSPQRSLVSHTMTTQRLGLTKANRIGAVLHTEELTIDTTNMDLRTRSTTGGQQTRGQQSTAQSVFSRTKLHESTISQRQL